MCSKYSNQLQSNGSLKLSIIIPVYNGEKYIDRCLGSLLNQIYDNIEIICVDDCSTDNSYGILKKYSEKFPNIKLLKTPKNSGCCSNPRNLGLKNSTGDYVQFLDIDDYLADKFVVHKLMSLCLKNDLDFLRFTFKVVNQ